MPDQQSERPIPEKYRRRALFAALYHHDGVNGASAPSDRDGAPITVEFPPDGHPDHDPNARQYVKRVAGALGFSFASRGPFEVRLRPDTEHAKAGLRGEY